MQKGCIKCGTQFEATNNRAAYCSICIKERKRMQDKQYRREARAKAKPNKLCHCGAIYVPKKAQKQCDKCIEISKIKKTKPCDQCKTPIKTNRLLCDSCKASNAGHKCVTCTNNIIGYDQKCKVCKLKALEEKGHSCRTCNNTIFGMIKYCETCRVGRKFDAMEKQKEARRKVAATRKGSGKSNGTVENKKYLTRGKLHFEGLGTL